MGINYELIAKLAPIVFGGFAVWKIVADVVIGRYGRRRDDYRFAREFLRDLDSTPNMHPFLREKGYQALAGDDSLTAEEVTYLLSLNNSSRALKDYVLGGSYLSYLATASGAQIALRKKYQSAWALQWRKLLYFCAFVLFYFLFASPVVLRVFRLVAIEQALQLLIVTALLFLPFAVMSLREGVRIARAEVLANDQTKASRERSRTPFLA